MDSLSVNSGLNVLENNQIGWQVYAFPNPSSREVRFAFTLKESNDVILQVLDMEGKIIYHKNYGNHSTGLQHISWGINNSRYKIPSGIYIYSIKAGENRNYGKVIIQ